MEQIPQPSSRPVRYFIEEKLVFAIESAQQWDLDTAARRNYLREVMPSFIRDRLGLDGAEVKHVALFDRQAVLMLDDTPSSAAEASISAVTALVFAEIEGLDDETLIRKIEQFQAQLRESQGIMLAQNPPLTVTAISPDWLASTAAEQDGTGGPGGRPVAWLESDGVPRYELVPDDAFTGCSFALKELFGGACQREVDVAILDTAPSRCVLQDAYRFWGPDSTAQHPLVEALLDPNSLAFDLAQITNNTHLWVCYADSTNYPNNPEMARLNSPLGYGRIVEHVYRMPDHGLFIAGIIHSLVPQARLYLIQVINDWGICSISSIVAGLEKLVEVRSQMGRRVPLVINLSLVLSLPREKAHEAAHEGRSPDWLDTRRHLSFDADMSGLFQKIADLLSGTPNSIVVAAAGNDGVKRALGNPPKTRYPAAFSKVTGVGALEQITRAPGHTRVKADYTPYSNTADDPENRGFITFGGKIAPGNASDQAVADKTGGILGIYTGDFPDGTFNTTGWARWAGTSFATPVVAGLIAKLLCMDASLLTTDAVIALRDLVAEASTMDAEIVPVHQPL